ncbi:MAG: diacylglycerol kinase family lipid kinase [Chloroflexi bacterium]|nr:diacylglycerol kinase family lipid kinase [Chloroflexota bacterium]
MSRYKIIINPTSGRGAGQRAITPIEQMLREHQLDFEIALTERPWHAAELAQQAAADGFDIVVAVGGDGTANEVLNGLMLAKRAGIANVAMGVLSVGRGNDFAFGVDVPRDLAAGCRVLAQNRRRVIDIGLATGGLHPEGRYFGNGVGIGFDAVVGFVAVKMKRLSGFPSYIVAALKTIFLYYRAPLVKIEFDGQTITQRALMVSTMNGRRLGGGFKMSEHGKTDDGLFDLTIARQVSRAKILALIPKFLQGTQASDPAVQIAQARRVVVTALEGVLPAHIDGETLCVEGKQLTLELAPRQIEIVTVASQEDAR